MRKTKDIHTKEAREEFLQVIFQAFGKDLSPENANDWATMLIDEAESAYDEYDIYATDAGELWFRQYGPKEYYHDGSCEPRKFLCVKPISQEDYNQAKTRQCTPRYSSHAYSDRWLARGEERFLTYWQGLAFDYLFYAKNLTGLPYVLVTIESLY